MGQLQDRKKKKQRCKRSIVMVLLAWAFIGGQALLAAGSVYNYHNRIDEETEETTAAWSLIGQGADRVRLVAMQAQPDVIGSVAVFLAVANVLGLSALVLGLLSWSRSKHLSGRWTIAAAVAVILVNSLLNLPHV